MLSQRELQENFRVDVTTGQLYWAKRGKGRQMGKPLGTLCTTGYLQVRFKGTLHMVHRVIWTHLNGEIEGNLQVDHINCNPLDNRPLNLRTASPAQNKANSRLYSTNTTGFKGVSRTRGGKYRSYICVDYKAIYLGTFDTPEEAARAYDLAGLHYKGGYQLTNKKLGNLNDRQPEQLRFASSM